MGGGKGGVVFSHVIVGIMSPILRRYKCSPLVPIYFSWYKIGNIG